MSEQLRQQILNVRAKQIAERERRRASERGTFTYGGHFALEETITKWSEDVECRVHWSIKPSFSSFIYLITENDAIRYVGETGDGGRRLAAYRKGYEGQSHSTKISNLIFECIQKGRTVEIHFRQAAPEKAARIEEEFSLIELFETRKVGWNAR